MPKISIILPIYNVAEYLDKSLTSLIQQTLTDIEIICVNDGSSDNSLSILEKYANTDKRIKIVNLPGNFGQGFARNKGIEVATGEYLGFVDPDDWAEVNMYEELYECAKRYNSELVEANHYVQNEIRNYRKKYRNKMKFPHNKCFTWRDINPFGAICAPWNKIYKTTFVKTNKILFGNGRYAEDQIFTIKSRLLAKKIAYCNKPIYNYRIRRNSCLNIVNLDTLKRPELLNEVKYFLLEHNFMEQLNTEYTKYALEGLTSTYKRISTDKIEEYENNVRKVLSEEEFLLYKKQIQSSQTLITSFFSVTNDFIDGKKYKVLTIFGKKFRWNY